MMTKIIGIIGLGSISGRHRDNIRKLCSTSKIICMPSDLTRLNRTAENCDLRVSSVKELISEKPEFVIVASPSPYHLQHSKELITAGIPIFFEKPLAHTLNDCLEISVLLKEFRVKAAVGYCLRYMPSAVELKKIIEEKRLGTIFHCQINVGQFLPDWRPTQDLMSTVSANRSLGGGALLELSHEIDYAMWLFGELDLRYAKIQASKELGLEVEDIVDISAENAEGIVVNIHLDFLQKRKYRKCKIIGTNGSLTWNLVRNEITITDEYETQVVYEEQGWNLNDMYQDEIKDFIRFIRNEQSNCCATIKEAKDVLEFIEAVKKFPKKI